MELTDQNQQIHSQDAEMGQSRISQEKVQLFESANEQLPEKNRALTLELKETRRELRVQQRLKKEYSQQITEMKSAFARDAVELDAISGQFPSRDMETSFSKTTENKTSEFGGASPSNDLTLYEMESFYFYLI
jgi:hypothetical protein